VLELKILLLILVANGAPLLAYDLLRQRWGRPVDGGLVLADGRRLLGYSCTWRGLLAAMACTPLVALVLGLPPGTGLLIGLLSMAGDALSSFVKRRLGLAPGSRALGLDQIPESLLPALGIATHHGLSLPAIALVVTGFFLAELLLSQLLYRMHLRKHPY
jgi:CDP-diglyceride synthetase